MANVTTPKPAHVQTLAASPHISESDRTRRVLLACNENPLGPSPRVLELLSQGHSFISRYPDPSGLMLRQALAQHYGLGSDQVVLGNGSSEILALLAQAYLAPNTSAVYSQYTFIVHPLVTQAVGARGIEVAACAFGCDPEALLCAITGDTRVLFIANPNNPTGTLIKPDLLLALIQQVPSHVLVVLDEAYIEYLPKVAAPASVTWLDRFPNLLITRTFSKAYGLAGLRIGYALAHPHVAERLNRMRQSFNVNALAQAAALIALADNDHLDRTARENRLGVNQLARGLEALGIVYIPTNGNFITIRVGDALRVQRGLLECGVLVRDLVNYGMPEHLRVSVGTSDENARFLHALKKQFLTSALS